VPRTIRALSTLATDRQHGWRRYTIRTGRAAEVPAILADVIADVTAFADPVLAGALDAGASWEPAGRRWSM
jgi:hypothetical protein